MQRKHEMYGTTVMLLSLVAGSVLLLTGGTTMTTDNPATNNPPAVAQTTAQPPASPTQEIPEVLTRGPVHEAFAQPVDVQVQAGLVIHKQPPANIHELPPAERPANDYDTWVPGYWSWDADRNDFVWVSGCWRAAPPGMKWVPGYWATESNGWEWVAGFWASADTKELNYLPAPPAAEEIDAPGQPPDEADMWVPGCWYWNDGQYILRHGYWLHQQPGWLWVPSHYCWTPRGYVFAAGHWDYTLDQRGVLFSPVYFPPDIYNQPDYVYTPDVCVDVGLLPDYLFAYPCYSHYFFGDYYDSFYFGCGIYPWFASPLFHTWCCPTFAYCRWQGGLRDRNWETNVRRAFDRRASDPSLRPARTLVAQNARAAALTSAARANVQLGKPLAAVAAATPAGFTRINMPARREIARQANEVHVFQAARTGWERPSSVTPPAPAIGERGVPGARTDAARVPAAGAPFHAAPTPASGGGEQHAPVVRWYTPYSAPAAPSAPAPQPQAQHEFRPTYEPPRAVTITQPEPVRIPTESVWRQPAVSVPMERTPPSHPSYESSTGSTFQRRGR